MRWTASLLLLAACASERTPGTTATGIEEVRIVAKGIE